MTPSTQDARATGLVELAGCPLCGAQPRRNGRGRAGGVLCIGDGKTVGMIHRFQTYGVDQSEADVAWNTRALAASTKDQNDDG